MNNKITVEDLTIKTISSLENSILKNRISCLGLEVNFANNKRRADIVAISKENHLIAFEIKSDYDNLLRLNSQLDDYEKSFDYTYIIITPKYLDEVTEIIGNRSNIGVLLYENNKMKNLNKAKKSQRLNKKYIASLVDKDIILDNLEIREIKDLAIQTLKQKLLPIYKEFKSNYMPPYTTEQFSILSMPKQLKYYLGL